MDADLEKTLNLAHKEEAIFNVLRSTLQYPASSEARSQKLVNDIIFFCTSTAEPPFWEIWPAVLALGSCIQPGHEWQATLIQSLRLLRQLDDSIAQGTTGSLKDLPDLTLTLTEHWQGHENPIFLDPDHPPLTDVLERWKNLNSFLARLPGDDYLFFLRLGLGQVGGALEVVPPESDSQLPLAECKIWTGTEWIIHCGRRIFKAVASKDSPENTIPDPGPLLGDIPKQSIERWEFWKKRLTQIAADYPTTANRIQQALDAMKEAELEKKEAELEKREAELGKKEAQQGNKEI
ncbi:unnamed protein product [Clonostachys byssicola]|uniref:Uncharacterized protein n=1 Tax=Clonostachys byssicola TaxID=160290 RepID=A0A9N9UJC6_9HYPO|nr:unnamed protein product [Clonostachys byssicola]